MYSSEFFANSKLDFMFSQIVTAWPKESSRGSSMWSTVPAGTKNTTLSSARPFRGPGAGRSARAEDPHRHSTDPCHCRWTPRCARTRAPPAPPRAHSHATETLRASRRRRRGGRKNRVTTRVRNWGVDMTPGKMISSRCSERKRTRE